MSTIIIILFLILLNAFFSLSEMAIVASSRPVLRNMAKKGNKKAQIILDITQDEGRFLSTIQVGITAVGTLAAAYGGATIAKSFGLVLDKIPFINPYGESIAITIVVIILTYVSVTIGELIPKKIALRNPEGISVFVATPMLTFVKVFSPMAGLLNLSADVVMKFFGILGGKEDKVTEAELRAIINEGAETGVIDKSEHEIMQRIFRLDNRDAKSIMTHVSDLVFLKIDDSDEEIKRKLHKAEHTRYPVVEGHSQKIIGIVQSKDLLSDYVTSGKLDLQKHLKDVRFIPENINCLKVLEIFKASSVKLAVVIDEYGATEGIVTASDIFESIVGIIPANYDEKDQVMIQKREDGSWLVEGGAPIDEINIVIGIEEINSESRYDTISGFVLDNLEHSPKEGAKFIRYDHSFEIVDMDGVRVDKILITNLQDDSKDRCL